MLTRYDPPARLAYSMPGMNAGEQMRVSVEFIERGEATEMRLTQTPVTAGWTAAFNRLNRFFDGAARDLTAVFSCAMTG